MKKAFRTKLALLLSVMMIVSILPITASAETHGDLTYSVSNGKVTITDCSVSATVVEIPSAIDGYPVTCIGDSAFYYCTSLTSITIPDSVTSIGNSAFWGCSSLKNITVDANNKYYLSDEYGVLFNKDKTDLIQYPAGNNRTSYIIPDSVTSISDSAFRLSTSLTSIIIPDSVTSISDSAFQDCTSLTSITINNPDCEIYDSSYTIYSGAIIYGYCGSTAQAYAEKYNRSFVAEHKYTTSKILTPATHLAEGIMIFTCTCGDAYTEAIAKLEGHTYKEVVTAPTCTAEGFTTYTCECGDSYVDDYVDATGHSHTSEITTPATHLTEGVLTYTCACGDTYTESIAKTTEHTYNADVTAPSCTEQGYTTYTCECGDSYVDDYVDATGHSHTSEITTPATHLTEGIMTFTCTCGDTYTEVIAKTPDHSHNAIVTAPTCTAKGFTTYTCECGDTYIADYVDVTGHDMGNWENDVTTNTATRECKNCDYTETKAMEEEKPQEDTSDNHNWIFKLIDAFVCFFRMLARIFG